MNPTIQTSTQVNYYPMLIGLVMIVEKFYINKKANQPGWYAIIPFYSDYLLFKYADRPKDYFKHLLASFFSAICLVLPIIYYVFYLILGVAYMDGEIYYMADVPTLRILLHQFLYSSTSPYIMVLMFLLGIGLFAYSVYLSYKRWKYFAINFNCEEGYKWGLLFLPVVFLGILAFDKNYQYKITQESVNYNTNYPIE